EYPIINIDNICKLNKSNNILFSKIPIKFNYYLINSEYSLNDIKFSFEYSIGISILFVVRKTKTKTVYKLYILDKNKEAYDCINILHKYNKCLFDNLINHVKDNNIEYFHGLLYFLNSDKNNIYESEKLLYYIHNNYTIEDELGISIIQSITFDNNYIYDLILDLNNIKYLKNNINQLNNKLII